LFVIPAQAGIHLYYYVRSWPDGRVGGCPTAGIFLLLVQKKGTKEKDTRKLVGISNPNSLRFLNKTGAAQLAQCYAFNTLKQCSLIPRFT
jgi:hypothetical protein